MSFCVSSAGPGSGADLGGLAGADRQCQSLASAAGAGGHTWHAYLSTNAHASWLQPRDGCDEFHERLGSSSFRPMLRSTGGAGLLYCFAAD